MKKILYSLFCIASFSALEASRIMDLKGHDFLEFRAGEFFFTQQSNRDTYGSEIITLEVEDNHFLSSKYSVWGNVNVAWSSGKTRYFETPTDMSITIVSIGGKRFVPVTQKEIKFYLGVGITAGVANTTCQNPYLSDTMTRFSPGVVGKFGFIAQHKSNFAFDLFFDYYIQPTLKNLNGSFFDKATEIGGFHAGVGIGYIFD
ncbi:MAG: hypothetical protein SP4CHLAM5_07890 [Chlamydiia bacterium]|nr:hypothetical protein [Chlamydiia bacterium]MCH9618653.1 hypothetical protein [Chlamydiia bacterium]MCH9623844.1 hypothetical protein [Chlamydiia bacterium]